MPTTGSPDGAAKAVRQEGLEERPLDRRFRYREDSHHGAVSLLPFGCARTLLGAVQYHKSHSQARRLTGSAAQCTCICVGAGLP